ncbi:CorA family divalent cation transporter [Pediococcus parvulus]
MKTLSELSIVLSIPTIIFGFWGMNTKVPLSNESHGTVVIITVLLICSILVYNWLKKKKYL